MEMLGERLIGAPRQVIWDTLNDAAALKRCLPGCDRLEKVSDSAFEATITAKVGPVKTTFVGSVTLSDINPPSAYTISFEGKGGAAGFAKGSAKVQLADRDGGTHLQYVVAASLGGKLGQMGSRVVDGVARQMADDFFGRFADIVTPQAIAERQAITPSAGLPETRISPLQWALAGLAVIVLAIIAFLAVVPR
ncbi:MAG: carbon monoxide dehydrogenase subunit G [Burkholderiales bacterium]|nr:carbon monoxide dehydrogenase subunit G [Burkholderiales bacterium]